MFQHLGMNLQSQLIGIAEWRKVPHEAALAQTKPITIAQVGAETQHAASLNFSSGRQTEVETLSLRASPLGKEPWFDNRLIAYRV
jgi:hypothetical protein